MSGIDCCEARRRLWPPERPRLVGGGVAEARAHVESCDCCADYFAQDRRLLDVYETLRCGAAPRDVWERVFDTLSEARWGLIRPSSDPHASDPAHSDADLAATGSRLGAFRPTAAWRQRLAVAALFAASLAAVALWPDVAATPVADLAVDADDPAMFVEDYLRRAVGQDHVNTTDPDEVVRFLSRELGMPLRPLDLEGLLLERAEICLFEGQRAALIVYKKDGAAISHYLVPRTGGRKRGPAVSETVNASLPGDLPVVTWATDAVEHALVGEVSAEDLMVLAHAGATE